MYIHPDYQTTFPFAHREARVKVDVTGRDGTRRKDKERRGKERERTYSKNPHPRTARKTAAEQNTFDGHKACLGSIATRKN